MANIHIALALDRIVATCYPRALCANPRVNPISTEHTSIFLR